MAQLTELLNVAKENKQLLSDLAQLLQHALNPTTLTAEPQRAKFDALEARIRAEIPQRSTDSAVDDAGQANANLRRQVMEENITVLQEAQQKPGLSPGDIVLLKAQEASLHIALAASAFDAMQPFKDLLTEQEWVNVKRDFEQAVTDLRNRKTAKACLDATVKLAILAAKLAAKL
jgi:hypothetical protein